MNKKELIKKFKEKILFLKSKLSEEYEELVKRNSIIEKLRLLFENTSINDYTNVIINLPSEEIFEYASFFGIRCTIDELNKYRFVVSESAFKGSYRFKEAKGYFDNIALKLRNESLKRTKTDRVEFLKENIDYIGYLEKRISNGKIKGPIDNIDKAMELFDMAPVNGFTDPEKKAIVKAMVVADLDNLIKANSNIEEIAFEEHEAKLDQEEEVPEEEVVEEETPVVETPEVVEDIPLEEQPAAEEEIKTYRSVVPQDKINLLNIIGLYADGIIDTYSPKTPTHEEYLNNIVPQILSGEITVDMLRDVLVVDKQYAYVLAVFLRDLVLDLNDFLNTKEENDEATINELFNEQMVEINAVYFVLKEIVEKINKTFEDERPSEDELTEDGKFKIVFVRNGLESYFSKSLLELRSYENIANVEKMLVELENGNFANDRKIKEFKYKTKGSFAIFYRVKNGHVLVFSIMLARDISNKKTDKILSLFDWVDEIRAIRDRTPEYDEMIEDSQKEREELQVMLGVATNGIQF